VCRSFRGFCQAETLITPGDFVCLIVDLPDYIPIIKSRILRSLGSNDSSTELRLLMRGEARAHHLLKWLPPLEMEKLLQHGSRAALRCDVPSGAYCQRVYL
jgi:hypothetical protein